MFQETKKSQCYFSRDNCCEVTVKNVRKSIFSMFWAINHDNHLSWWNLSAVIRFLGMLPIRNISYLPPMCYNFWEKCINSHKIGQGCSNKKFHIILGISLLHPVVFLWFYEGWFHFAYFETVTVRMISSWQWRQCDLKLVVCVFSENLLCACVRTRPKIR